MILEDHLKHVITRTGPVAFKVSANKLLPRPQDSAFGNFPASHKSKKTGPVLEPMPLAAQEQSVAATKVSKLHHLLNKFTTSLSRYENRPCH